MSFPSKILINKLNLLDKKISKLKKAESLSSGYLCLNKPIPANLLSKITTHKSRIKSLNREISNLKSIHDNISFPSRGLGGMISSPFYD